MPADRALDALDAALLADLSTEPRASVLELARRHGVARGTVQARMDRWQRDGVVRGYGPQVDPAAIGHPVTAFLTLELRQERGRAEVERHLGAIAEVLEAHTITGSGDLLVRVVARSNTDLQRVIDTVVSDPAVSRTSTVIALHDVIPFRTSPLVASLVRDVG